MTLGLPKNHRGICMHEITSGGSRRKTCVMIRNTGSGMRLRIEHSVALAHEVISAWVRAQAAGKSPESRAIVDQKMQTLLGFLLDSYDTQLAPEDALRVFNEAPDLSIEHLVRLPEAAVPVAIVREVFHVARVKCNMKIVTNWAEFANRYGLYLMAA